MNVERKTRQGWGCVCIQPKGCHPSDQYICTVRTTGRAKSVLNNAGEKRTRTRQHACDQTKVLAKEIQDEVIAIVKQKNESVTQSNSNENLVATWV